MLRSRQSLLPQTPRKKWVSSSDGGTNSADAAMSTNDRSDVMEAVELYSSVDDEREQRLMYLRQAFCGFFKAKQGMEMQNLARVMCAILGVSPEDQAEILESIERLVPALVATSTLESLSYNLTSFFS